MIFPSRAIRSRVEAGSRSINGHAPRLSVPTRGNACAHLSAFERYALTDSRSPRFVKEISPIAAALRRRENRRNTNGWSADRAAHHRRDRAGAGEGGCGRGDPRADRAHPPDPAAAGTDLEDAKAGSPTSLEWAAA